MSARSKPRASEPARPAAAPAKPPTARKASEPGSAKFYNGPTVPSNPDVKATVKTVASSGASAAKKQTRKAVATAKRHPYSLMSLLGTVPLLLVASLFSTVLCPAPAAPPSTFSRIALSPLGLYHPASHSQLHETLCYPSHVYREQVLEPYVYPAIDDASERLKQHPVVVDRVLPVAHGALQGYDRALKPVVDRIVRGAKKFHLYYVHPHLPYLYSKLDAATAPVKQRAATLYTTHAAPHLSTLQAHARLASQKSVETWHFVMGHPVTETAGVYLRKANAQAYRSYVWGRPQVVKAAQHTERFAREHVSPRAVKAISWAADQASKGVAVAKIYIAALYDKHLQPHVGPYVTKASLVVAPYVAAYNQHFYEPYIRPVLHHYLPELAAPEKPTSFFQLIADKLPAFGSLNVAESRGSVDSFVNAAAKEKTKVMTKSASKSAPTASSASTPSPSADRRAELAASRDAIEQRVDIEGERGYAAARQQVSAIYNDFAQDQLPRFVDNGRSSLEREIDHILVGLDKLYTTSQTLSRDQVKESSEMTESKVGKVLHQARDTIETKRAALQGRIEPVVRRAKVDVHDALGSSFDSLADRMTLADASPKEWDQYNALKTNVAKWQQKYDGLLEPVAFDGIHQDINAQIAEANVEYGEIFDGFRARLGIMKRAALDRIDERELGTASSSAGGERFSILPIAEAGAAGQALIGKSKEQVVQALGQANAAASNAMVGAPASASSIASQISASASSAYDAASDAAHHATRSALYAVGATPSPESLREHAASFAGAVQERASSAYNAASGVVREAAQGVGAEPALASASSIVHHATRSAASAIGVTPLPESPQEHIDSLASVISGSAFSAAAVVSDSAMSIASAASSVVHDASRSAIRAAGARPFPESPGEHVESVIDAATSKLASGTAAIKEALPTEQAAELASSLQTALGLVPSETPLASSASAYASSLASAGSSAGSDLVASGSSLLSALQVAASSSLHSATRAASRAVGATPSAESVGDYVDDVKAKAAEARRQAESLVRKHASTLLPEVSASPDVLKGHVHDGEAEQHSHAHPHDEL